MIENIDITVGAFGMLYALLFKKQIKSVWENGFIVFFLSQLILVFAGIIRLL